jgi:hypothetical protein
MAHENELATVHRMLTDRLHRTHVAVGWDAERAANVATELLEQGLVINQLVGPDGEIAAADFRDLRLWEAAPLLLDIDRVLPAREHDDGRKALRAEVRAIRAQALGAGRPRQSADDGKTSTERLAELNGNVGKGSDAERIQRSLDRAKLAEAQIRAANPGSFILGDE